MLPSCKSNVNLVMSKKILFIVLSVFLSSFCQSSFAEATDPYIVERVAASANSKSAGNSKTLAVASARRDAFLITLTRLSLPTSIADNVTNDDIFDMVMSEQITEEKIAGNNYSAIFNITFAKSAVDNVLQNKNIKKEEIKEDVFLLIPVKIIKFKTLPKSKAPEKFLLWESENDWKLVLEKSLKSNSSKKFIIPQSEVDNIATLNFSNFDQIEYSQIEPILTKYNATAAYVIFFLFDDIENKVSIKVQNIRKLQKKQVKMSFLNVDRLDYEALLKKVAEKTLEYLTSAQKEETAKSTNIAMAKITIPIANLGDYLMIKNKIESNNLVNQMAIESLSKDYAKISVGYTGDKTNLVENFAKFGLFLTQKSEGNYILLTTKLTTQGSVNEN